jgi:uridine phosphorylase
MPDHLGINSTDARIAIIMGTPQRVPLLASFFDKPLQLTDRRGFLIYEAFLENHKILFVSSGIGGPSTAIVIEELIDLGLEIIIRVGTCGSLLPSIRPGDIVISSGAIRAEGTSRQYIDSGYPAIPDPILLNRIINAASANGIAFHLGITHCKDAYYLEKPGKQLSPTEAGKQWEIWRNANALATEMEAAVLFVLGSIRGITTAAIFINVGKEPQEHLDTLENIVKLLKHSLPATVETLPGKSSKTAPQEDSSFLDHSGKKE